MRRIAAICFVSLFVLSAAHKTLAQDAAKPKEASKAQEDAKPAAPPIHYYHLDFVIQELDANGKPVNSRSYATIVTTDRSDSNVDLRTGSRVPIVTAGKPTASETEKLETQFQYIDVGVRIDTRGAHEIGDQFAIHLHAEISSLAEASGTAERADPVIRQNSWDSAVLIPIGKPTVVFSSDALESKGRMQLVVTATLLQ
jgi:type II secretory pathway component GspD/PulD (secretin)